MKDKGSFRVLITGGGDGIGFYMAQQLLDDGHRVAVLDLKPDKLEALAERYGERLLIARGDVTDAGSAAACVREMEEHWGGVDAAVHNACACPFKDFSDTTREDFDRTFHVNYFGAVNVARAALPLMRRRKSGRVASRAPAWA